MNTGLEGKVALVTGGSDGIGLAIASAYAEEGSQVVICGRDQDRLKKAKDTIERSGKASVLALRADVTVISDVARLCQEVIDRFATLHVLVNNTGGPPSGNFESINDEQWLAAFHLTHLSTVRMTRLFLPHFRRQKWGRVINVSSYSIKQPIPNMMLSNSIRMAALGWAKSLATEVAADNILVNTICPGWTRTARVGNVLESRAAAEGRSAQEIESEITRSIPLRRMASPEEIAGLAVFLGSNAASYITGNAIQVDGGITAGPY